MRLTSTPSWVWHLLVWLAYLAVTVWLFGLFRDASVAIWRSLILITLQAALFYLNANALMPLLLEQKKGWAYAGLLLGSLVLYLWLNRSIDQFIHLDNVRPPHGSIPGHRAPHPPMGFRKVGHILVTGLPAVAVLFVSSIYYHFRERRLREKLELDLKNHHLMAEMQFLRSQVNPHFLFNALNNIYSLTQTGSPKAPEMVLKLSELLRYVLYESSGSEVSLGKEVQYIRNFIAIQLLKDDNIINVSFDTQGIDENRNVAPLLLLPFVENAFKHSKIEDTTNGFIRMQITTGEHELIFRCENSLPAAPTAKDDTGGVGLANVKRRLELLYPNRHEIQIDSENARFLVQLTLQV